MAKSYINQAEKVSNKMIMNPNIILQCPESGRPYAKINVFYPSIWYGTLWAVEYMVDINKVINERCYGGAMIYTTEQDRYPKIPHEIIIEYYNNFMKNPKYQPMHTETIDLEKELSIRNISISILSGENKK